MVKSVAFTWNHNPSAREQARTETLEGKSQHAPSLASTGLTAAAVASRRRACATATSGGLGAVDNWIWRAREQQQILYSRISHVTSRNNPVSRELATLILICTESLIVFPCRMRLQS